MKRLYFFAIILFIAISADCQNAYFTYNKAYAQLLYKNYEGAISLFNQAITEKPDLADAYANRGLCYYKLKQYDKAVEDYLKDNSLKPDRSSYNLACVYSLLNKKDDAFKYLELVQKTIYKQTVTVLEGDGDFENLRTDPRWKTFIASDFFTPYDKEMIIANEKYAANDFDGSIEACDRAILIDKNDKRAYSSKGFIYSALEKNDESIAEYDKMIVNDANDYEGYAGKANVYYKLRNYAQALPLYEMATLKNPAYLPLYETGMCKYAEGKKDEGISDFKKYCEIYPFDDMTNYTVGRLLYDMERDVEAWYYAEKAIEINQTVSEYFMLRAYLNHVKKSWDAAISDYSKVINLNGEGKGEAYYKRGLCKAEKFAVTKEESYRSEFCSDLRMAKSLGISEGDDYLNELCN